LKKKYKEGHDKKIDSIGLNFIQFGKQAMKKYQIDPKLNKAEDFEYKGSEDINKEIGLSDYGEDDLMNGVEDVSEE